MNSIVKLLNEKNHFLKKFSNLNKVEIIKFEQGDFESLETFYDSRDKILDMIRYIDEQIGVDSEEVDLEKMSQSDIDQIKLSFEAKEKIVKNILSQDLKIISLIEKQKIEIIQDLKDISKNKKGIKGYHLRNFRNKIDEEI